MYILDITNTFSFYIVLFVFPLVSLMEQKSSVLIKSHISIFSLGFMLFRVLFKISFLIQKSENCYFLYFVPLVVQLLTVLPLSSIFSHWFFSHPPPMSSPTNPCVSWKSPLPDFHLTNSIFYFVYIFQFTRCSLFLISDFLSNTCNIFSKICFVSL